MLFRSNLGRGRRDADATAVQRSIKIVRPLRKRRIRRGPGRLHDAVDLRRGEARGGEPELVNVSGGTASATSLAQLSAWCAERFGPRDVAAATEGRPYDLPWVVLDHSEVTRRHGWQPTRSAATIFAEIADHAERHPGWLEASGG